MSGVHAKNTTGLQKTPAPATDLLTDAWNTSAPEIPPTPVVDPAADRDVLADARSLTPPTPAADPGDTTPPPANPAPAPDPDNAVVGLREAYDNHLSDIVTSLEALRWARHNDPDSPAPSTNAAPNSSTAPAASRSGPATGPAPAPLTPTDHPGPPTSANQPCPVRTTRSPLPGRTPGSPGTTQKSNTAP
ncbi:hypothetical protein OHA57_00420 [Streptomyces anulatus]|uniref:hypothetical protein n=1 Tax=Streptomyces anulatus TaxID=1892 RepID=UPI002DDB3FEE|nr:hypothetical protein [Streptomyces anulatus]WSC59286.1 hypothetical protein OHA57_00420 [Streptomyces anulatus]WTC68533.1 hypothetical protein OG865_38815 [Streptomyces anulatus]